MAGEVCGAASGAVMAIGLLYGKDQGEAVHPLTEQFMQRFAERNGTVRCIDIVGFNAAGASKGEDMSIVKGLLWFLARGGKRVCKKAVSSAVEVLLEQLEEWEK